LSYSNPNGNAFGIFLELLSSLSLVKSNHHTYQEVGEILEMEEQKTQEEVKEEGMTNDPSIANLTSPMATLETTKSAERLLTLDDFSR